MSTPSLCVSEGSQSTFLPRVPNSFLSLEMCTESLGSETGAAIDLHDTAAEGRPPKPVKKIKRGGGSSFPPPLSGGVRFQTQREGGRLLIKAFTVSPPPFRAERRNGRLRLSLLIHEVDGFAGHFWSSRCSDGGDMSRIEKLQSLPFSHFLINA